MNTLIKAVEIWLPTPDGGLLEFGGGLYGPATAFGAISRALCFGRGEGLPGRAWLDARPIVLETLDGSYFRRAEVAREAGFRCAIGLPIFMGEALTGVVVFFCGPRADAGGRADEAAFERWRDTDLPRGAGHDVVALLSSVATSIARRIEGWAPDDARQGLQRVFGFCEQRGPLRASDAGTVLAGAIGKAFASGVPVINESAATEPGSVGDAARDAGLSALLALPVVNDSGVGEVLALYF